MLKNISKIIRNCAFFCGTAFYSFASVPDLDLSLFDTDMDFTMPSVPVVANNVERSAPIPINLNVIKNVINIFELWQNTALVRSRHPLYLPSLSSDYKNILSVQWNLQFQKQTEMVYPFVDRLNLDFLKEPKALNLVKSLLQDQYALFEQGVSLFERMNVQERRGVFSTIIEVPLHDMFFLRFNTSIVGVQRNYGPENLEDEGNAFFKKVEAVVEGAVQNTAFFDVVNPTTLKASFAKIPYEVALGDAKIQLGFIPIQHKHLLLICGIECLPPLSSLFYSTKPKPEPEVFDIMYEMERIHRVVRNPVAGFGGNWGLGCFFEGKIPLFEGQVDLFSKISLDKILAKEVERDIIIDGEVFPHLLSTESDPGNIQHILLGVQGKYRQWHGSIGYDYYHQGKEFLSFSSEVPDDKRSANLDKSKQKESLQHSIFTSVEYEWKEENKEWLSVGLDGSVVFKHKNMGHHWVVGLKAKMLF